MRGRADSDFSYPKKLVRIAPHAGATSHPNSLAAPHGRRIAAGKKGGGFARTGAAAAG